MSLTSLLKPRSVAVIGATERIGASSSFVMRNLIDHRFEGEIYPVHPRAERVFGYQAAADIGSLKAVPDVAVICIPAQHVAGALEEVGRKGGQAAVILSSGFAEKDEEGRAQQKALVGIASRYGMSVCGPNCLGLINHQANTVLYSSRFPFGIPKGSVALISQSGAGAIALTSTGRIGFSTIISAGNSAVTDVPDYLSYLAKDPDTTVALLVLENIKDPARLAAAMRAMQQAEKPVIALYIGRSERGAAATAAHTGALAGSFDAVQAFFRRHGILSVDSMDELIETAALLTVLKRWPRTDGVAILGVSGGGVAHASDIASQVGLHLPELGSDTINRLKKILPPFTTPQNPLDTTGLPFADGNVYRQALRILADDPDIGAIVAVQDAPRGLDEAGANEYLPIAQGIIDYAGTAEVPVIVISHLSDGYHSIFEKPLQDAGIPALKGAAIAFRAIRHLVQFKQRHPLPLKMGDSTTPKIDKSWQKRFKQKVPFTEREAKRLLTTYGIRTTKERLAKSGAEAATLAKEIGFPVAMKVESPEIIHKSDVGAVCLNIDGSAAAQEAYRTIIKNVLSQSPNAAIHGVVVQEMVDNEVEAFVGLSLQAPFGFGIVVGLGGVFVELVDETTFDLLPLTPSSAQELVEGTHLNKLLNGFRGAAPRDKTALIKTIQKLADIVHLYGDFLEAIELNPIAVLPKGEGVCVLDAVIILKE